MKVFFITVAIFWLSLLLIAMLRNFMRRTNMTLASEKYYVAALLSIIIVTVLSPFVLLLVSRDFVTLQKATGMFFISLLASIGFVFFALQVRNILFKTMPEIDDNNETSLNDQTKQVYEVDLKTSIELDTLDYYGWDSAAGISFDSINRLGNQYSEWVMLERDINEVKPSSD